jgi:hypothetical protein
MFVSSVNKIISTSYLGTNILLVIANTLEIK